MTYEYYLRGVKQNGLALQFVPGEYRTSELVLAAITQNGRALRLVPLKHCTPALCMAALKQNGIMIRFLPQARLTPSLCMDAVKQNGDALLYVPYEYQTPALYAARYAHITIAQYNTTKLTLNTYGRYNAGRLCNLTHARALKHWGAPRADPCSLLFTQALLTVGLIEDMRTGYEKPNAS